MITSVLVMLAAESLVFDSWHLAAWTVTFFFVNMVYFARVEEPGLERRFGDTYRQYRANVPRWIPRLRPWGPPGNGKLARRAERFEEGAALTVDEAERPKERNARRDGIAGEQHD